MHEMAYVRNVVDIVLGVARERGAERVSDVRLTIGASRDIVEEYFQGLFQYLARGTEAEQATVEIRRVPLTVRCNRCGQVFPIDSHDPSTWDCPCCGARQDYRLNSGMEFLIDDVGLVMPQARPVAEDERAVSAVG